MFILFVGVMVISIISHILIIVNAADQADADTVVATLISLVCTAVGLVVGARLL